MAGIQTCQSPQRLKTPCDPVVAKAYLSPAMISMATLHQSCAYAHFTAVNGTDHGHAETHVLVRKVVMGPQQRDWQLGVACHTPACHPWRAQAERARRRRSRLTGQGEAVRLWVRLRCGPRQSLWLRKGPRRGLRSAAVLGPRSALAC